MNVIVKIVTKTFFIRIPHFHFVFTGIVFPHDEKVYSNTLQKRKKMTPLYFIVRLDSVRPHAVMLVFILLKISKKRFGDF